jgi:signal transduction histidine kinase
MRGVEILLRMAIREEHDIFVVRQRGREVAAALGMEQQDQVRVATALSEVGRQLLGEDGDTTVTFEVRPEPPSLAFVFWGKNVSGSDEHISIGRLMDVEVINEQLVLTRRLPPDVDRERITRAHIELEASRPTRPIDELNLQNRQLIAALEESQRHREELLQLNAELEETNHGVMALYTQLSQELEDTNRGVVALYAELEERSGQLREASEAKTRFLANVSHELRAPVTAIIGLTRLLLDARSDPLTEEQTHQLQLVQTSAADLLDRVNDLLDLAKAESGQIEPQWAPVELGGVFGQLRGTLRPMAKPGVELVVDDPALTLVTDEVLLTQILRNLLTNALKFTVTGEVRLSATVADGRVRFAVRDTGIGIPAEEHNRVFEEFHQVRGAQQIGGNGTGLGLPYARRLTRLLGGDLTMTSAPGEGSEFTVTLPLEQARPTPPAGLPRLESVLVVDADSAFRQQLRSSFDGLVDTVLEADDARSATAIAQREQPDAVFIDQHLADDDVLLTLARCPVVIVTDGGAPPSQVMLSHATVTLQRGEVNPAVIPTVLLAIAARDEP